LLSPIISISNSSLSILPASSSFLADSKTRCVICAWDSVLYSCGVAIEELCSPVGGFGGTTIAASDKDEDNDDDDDDDDDEDEEETEFVEA
jgi:hypothetical protein